MEKGEIGTSGDGFIDRSKVRILLCDNDDKSSVEVFTLLCKCSYQVISVKSPRQVIDALNAEGQDIDLILSEVDLPLSKGLKMLKYIKRDKELRRIPVIMMSAQDEVPIVVKCLKFGAADYLVKPLRTNELLNLWTHMWRRRRMLGLMEKNIINCTFDLVISDHSDANTNSTTLFSDDTDEKSLKSTNPEACIPTHQEDEANTKSVAPLTAANRAPPDSHPDMPRKNDSWTGQMSLFAKKSELKIGESSAFFTYTKTSMSKVKHPGACSGHRNMPLNMDNLVQSSQLGSNAQSKDGREPQENYFLVNDSPSTNSIPESVSLSPEERSCTPPVSSEVSQRNVPELSPNGVINGYPQTTYPYHIPGVMNQPMMPLNIHNDTTSSLLPHYNHIPQFPHAPGTASYPYYPFGICLQTGHPPVPPHPWPSFGNSSSNEVKVTKVDRREAALMKFRQKRKERCFDKKIRYVNRKKLAERRPRLRGQFVRKVNGINVDLNGQPASTEDDEEEEDEEEACDEEDRMAMTGGAEQ